jgi:hypothetical protein
MKKIAILVISCDNYSDLWDICSKMFNSNWPDCPYDKFILTNEVEYTGDTFFNLSIGEDIDWSTNLKKALQLLENRGYNYVFTMVEDYFFGNIVDTKYLQEIINSFTAIKGDFLRLKNTIDPRIESMLNPYFGKIKNNIPYRQTVAFSVWRIEVLDNLLKVGENAWEFEKIGVRRGFSYEGFYAIPNNFFKTINLVIKGEIVPSELKKIKYLHPDLILNRKIMSSVYFIGMNLVAKCKLFILNYLPLKLRSKIYFNFLNKLDYREEKVRNN